MKVHSVLAQHTAEPRASVEAYIDCINKFKVED